MEAGRLDSKYWRISSSVPVRSSWWAFSNMGIMGFLPGAVLRTVYNPDNSV